MPTIDPPEPWRSFFKDVDDHLKENVDLHCCGGFVVIQVYGVARTTRDIDFLCSVPNRQRAISEIAGQGSSLHRKHRIYLDAVNVTTPPDRYQERLIPLFPGNWKHLQLYALEVHDLALTKLERNHERDRDDIRLLANAGLLNPEILKDRYYRELRPYLSRESWHDQTLQLWLESYFTVS